MEKQDKKDRTEEILLLEVLQSLVNGNTQQSKINQNNANMHRLSVGIIKSISDSLIQIQKSLRATQQNQIWTTLLLLIGLLNLFYMIMHDAINKFVAVPFQYIFDLYQKATPGEKLTILYLPIGGAIGFFFNQWLQGRKKK